MAKVNIWLLKINTAKNNKTILKAEGLYEETKQKSGGEKS